MNGSIANEMREDIKQLKDQINRINGIVIEISALLTKNLLTMNNQMNENREYLIMRIEKGDKDTLEASKTYIDNKANISKLQKITWVIGLISTGGLIPYAFKFINSLFTSN